VIGHGVDPAVIRAMATEATAFFDLSAEDKMTLHVAHSPNYRGYVPSYSRAYSEERRQALESFSIGLELDAADPDYRGHPLHGPNPWPEGLPAFRKAALAYWDALTTLSEHLMRGFALALELPETEFHRHFTKPTTQIRLINYPAGSAGKVEVGVTAHRDSGAFTILWQDGTGGLEVQTPEGNWIAATPVEGAFVVNIGDTMKVWTGGLFNSTPHRVINRSDRRRQSIAYFANCDFDTELAPLPQYRDAEFTGAGSYGEAILSFFERFLGSAKQDLERD
jgi:isopenicillin N synthase-like dioxygenase